MDIDSFAKKHANIYNVHQDTIKRIYKRLIEPVYIAISYDGVIREIEQKCPKLFENKEFWEDVIEKNHDVYPYIPLKVKMLFPTVCEIAILKDSDNVKITPKEVLNAHPYLYKVILQKDIRLFYKMRYLIETNPDLYLQLCHYVIDTNSSYVRDIPADFLKKHPELYQKAIKADPENFKYVPNERKTYELSKAMIDIQSDLFKHVPIGLKKKHPDLCYLAVEKNLHNLKYVTNDFIRDNLEFCIDVIKSDPQYYYLIQILPINIQIEHIDLCELIVEYDPTNIRHIHEEVKILYPILCYKAIMESKYRNEVLVVFSYIPNIIKIKYPFLCIKALEQNGDCIEYTPDEFQINYPDIISTIVHKDMDLIKYVAPQIRPYVISKIRQKEAKMIHDILPEVEEEDKVFYTPYVKMMGKLYKLYKLFKRYKTLVEQGLTKSSKEIQKTMHEINSIPNIDEILQRLNITKNDLFNNISVQELDEKIFKCLTTIENENYVFRKKIFSNPYDLQRFIPEHDYNVVKNDEIIISLYMDKKLYNELMKDPILVKFIMHQSEFMHFVDNIPPIGWAIVYVPPTEPDTWYISQIQSDIIADFNSMYRECKAELKQRHSLTIEELQEFMDKHDRGDYLRYNILDPVFIKHFLTHPNSIMDLPSLKDNKDLTPEERMLNAKNKYMQYYNHMITLIQNQHITIGEKDKLGYLSSYELEYIKNKLKWLIDNWFEIIFYAVWLEAKKRGIKHIYMNTHETLNSGLPLDARIVWYKQKPKELGFEKKESYVRGKGPEMFWYRENANIIPFIKLANKYDNQKKYKLADKLDQFLFLSTCRI